MGIFEAAGTPLNLFFEAAAVALVQAVGTALSLVVVDRAGRRVLLLGSASCMAVALIGLGEPGEKSLSFGLRKLMRHFGFCFPAKARTLRSWR